MDSMLIYSRSSPRRPRHRAHRQHPVVPRRPAMRPLPRRHRPGLHRLRHTQPASAAPTSPTSWAKKATPGARAPTPGTSPPSSASNPPSTPNPSTATKKGFTAGFPRPTTNPNPCSLIPASKAATPGVNPVCSPCTIGVTTGTPAPISYRHRASREDSPCP